MAISRSIPRKAPSQAPTAFFECKQSGGAKGATSMPSEKPVSGKMRESIYGKKKYGRSEERRVGKECRL